LQQEFLKKYFLIGKTNDIRRAIISISQYEREQLYETWEKLKDLLRSCPHHAVPKWQLVQSFYEGLTEPNGKMVDASCGGTYMMKSEDEAWTLFENLSNNSIQHASTRRRAPAPKAPKTEGLFEIGHSSDVVTQVVDAITRKLDQMMVASFAPNSTHMYTQHAPCSFCSSPMHHINDCPTAGKFSDDSIEQVNAAFSHPGNDPYSNTYNPGWRNHPNFSWKAQDSSNSVPGVHNQAQSNKQPYQSSSTYRPAQQRSQATPSPRLDSDFQDQMLQFMSNINQTMNSHSQAIAKLEVQM